VVVPVKDDPEGLHGLLHALGAQTWSDRRVVVVDNGSTTSAVKAVAVRHGAEYVVELALGSYAARNAGVAHATGDVVAFTDADCRPAPDWLEAAVRVLLSADAPDVIAGRVRVTARDAGRPSPAEAWELVHGFRQESYVRRAGWGATANLVVPRPVLSEVGPFDARLLSGGDADWGVRASAMGLTIAYCDDVVVDHPARVRMSDLLHKLRRVQAGAYRQAVLRGERLPQPLVGGLGAFRPPLGAVSRAWAHPALRSPRARAAYVLAEWVVRLNGVVVRTSELRRARR